MPAQRKLWSVLIDHINGMSASDIAEKYGLSKPRVYQIINYEKAKVLDPTWTDWTSRRQYFEDILLRHDFFI